MKHHPYLRLAILALAVAPLAISAQSSAPQLNSVLQQMDHASANFRARTADFHCDYYERVVRDTTTQIGPIYFLRKGDATQMGSSSSRRAPIASPKVIEYKDGILQMFDPGVNQITVLHAGANQADMKSYFTLGFGGSGNDLAHSWNINDLGPETLSDGSQQVKTEKLDLTSKDAQRKKLHPHHHLGRPHPRSLPAPDLLSRQRRSPHLQLHQCKAQRSHRYEDLRDQEELADHHRQSLADNERPASAKAASKITIGKHSSV